MSQATVSSVPAPPPSPVFGAQDPFGFFAADFAGRQAGAGIPRHRSDANLLHDEDYRYMLRQVRDRIRYVRVTRGRGAGATPGRIVAGMEEELDPEEVDTPVYVAPKTIPREVKRLRIDMAW